MVSLMFNGTYALAASATSTFIVTFQQATLVSNDHVGNDWAIAVQVAGQSISEGNSVKVSSVSAKGYTVKLRVTITENRGRYSGQQAVWEFTYKIKKQ
ncbi:hypothetical protein EL23_22410 [Paenibacillus polymyxa]|nr:hypothetical protein EL23_22410 [Paenibacillus polymyxa]